MTKIEERTVQRGVIICKKMDYAQNETVSSITSF